MKRTFRLLLGVSALLIIVIMGIACRFVWPPDLFGRTILLGSNQSKSGEIFKVVQFWSDDFYRTQLEHINPDGSINEAIIDSDDRKQWSCTVEVNESEKKVVIAIPAGARPFEYRWDQKSFVLAAGKMRLRD